MTHEQQVAELERIIGALVAQLGGTAVITEDEYQRVTSPPVITMRHEPSPRELHIIDRETRSRDAG